MISLPRGCCDDPKLELAQHLIKGMLKEALVDHETDEIATTVFTMMKEIVVELLRERGVDPIMKGTMLIYRPDSPHPEVAEYDTEEGHEIVYAAVGGHIELVPEFDTIMRDGEVRQCVAFCNEDGKHTGLRWNHNANMLWDRALERRNRSRFDEHGQPKDWLVGAIAVVYGSPEFMSAL